VLALPLGCGRPGPGKEGAETPEQGSGAEAVLGQLHGALRTAGALPLGKAGVGVSDARSRPRTTRAVSRNRAARRTVGEYDRDAVMASKPRSTAEVRRPRRADRREPPLKNWPALLPSTDSRPTSQPPLAVPAAAGIWPWPRTRSTWPLPLEHCCRQGPGPALADIGNPKCAQLLGRAVCNEGTRAVVAPRAAMDSPRNVTA